MIVITFSVWLIIFIASPLRAAIRVGLVIPLSGIEAKEGTILNKWANELALFLSKTGLEVNIIPLDSQAKPSHIPRLVREASSSNVTVLVGPAIPECATALVREAKRLKIPLILTSGEINPVKQIGNLPGPVFRVGLTTRKAVKVLYQCLKQKNYHQIGLLVTTDYFGKMGEMWLKAYAAEYRLHIKKVRYFSPYDTDVTAHLEALLDTGVVVCWAGPWASITVARNINQMKPGVPVYFSHHIAAEGLLHEYPSLIDKPFVGAAFLAPDGLPLEDKSLYKLLEDFLKKENLTYDPSLTALADAFVFLKKGLEEDGQKDLIKGIENAGLIKGLTGFYFLSPDDHYGLLPSTVGVFKYQNEAYQPVCLPQTGIL